MVLRRPGNTCRDQHSARAPSVFSVINGILLTHYAENSAVMGISLEEVKITVKGFYNPLPGHGFDAVEFDTHIRSSDTPDRIVELARRAENECYVTNTLKKAADVGGRLYLNGQPLALALKPGPDLSGT